MLRWITAHNEYQGFFESDRFYRTGHFYVPVLEGDDGGFAIGITISKKIGKAVVRNKLKRRIKAFFRSPERVYPTHDRINLIAKTGCAELSYQDLCMELEQVLRMLSSGKAGTK